jgi:hypothetical protein
MSKLTFSLIAALGLLFHGQAVAQSLPLAAEGLRESLRSLQKAVDDQVPKDEGRKEITSVIDKTRDELQAIHDYAARPAPREQIDTTFVNAHNHFYQAMERLNRYTNRGSIAQLVNEAREQKIQLDIAWKHYRPTYVPAGRGGFVPPQSIVVNRDTWARGIAINHLAGFFRVPPSTIEATTVERSGSRFRVFASSRKTGPYIVNLDAASGRVYSATPAGR